MLRRLAPERGVILPMTALFITALFGIVALAIDGGRILSENRHLQAVADQAGLSAAWAHCSGGDPVAAAVSATVGNGYQIGNVTLTPDYDPDTGTVDPTGTEFVLVELSSTIPTTFAKVIGHNTMSTSTRSVVGCNTSKGGYYAVFAGGDTCAGYGKLQLDIPGSDETVIGGTHTNGNGWISGAGNDFQGPFTHVDSFGDGGSGNSFWPGYPNQIGLQAWPITFDRGYYRDLALAGGPNRFYVSGEIDASYIQSHGDGLYYATGIIKMDASDITAAVTLVSEETIEFSGSNQRLTAYMDDLLAFGGIDYTGIDRCDKFGVSMNGSNNEWTGIVYAPKSLIEMNGSDNGTIFRGALIGWSVRLNGQDILIVGDFASIPGPPAIAIWE